MIALDTNVVSEFARSSPNEKVKAWMLRQDSARIWLCTVRGDLDTPMATGRLRERRESTGRPISVQDAMIAAICLENGATLATRNTRDFEGLDLKLVNPFEDG